MKEQIKTPEKQLSDKEIANLSDAQFKTLVIRMLIEMVEYGCKWGKSEDQAKWNKEKYTGNQQGRGGNQDSNQWFGAEGRNKPEQNEETRIQKKKNEERLRNLQDTLNIPTSEW